MSTRGILQSGMVWLLSAACLWGGPIERTVSTTNVDVVHERVGRDYAQAIADVCQTARDTFVRRFGCDMPKRLTVKVETSWSGEPQLFGNGRDEIVLRLENGWQLKRHDDEGIHFVYGLCREAARIALERTLLDAPWMSSTAREGWCHYAASVAIDAVAAERGTRVWPHRSDDYLEGMAGLRNQLDQRSAPPLVRAAGAWKALADLCNAERLGRVFKAWSKSSSDAPTPGPALAAAFGNPRLEAWFEKSRDQFIDPSAGRPEAMVVGEDKLVGHPVVLHYDDGKSEGRECLADGGHAMRFEAPAGEWYLRVIRIYARREGPPNLQRDDIQAWLCDKRMKVLAEFRQHGRLLRPGGARWHRIGTPPVRVPREFVILVRFGRGPRGEVAVYYDTHDQGHASIAVPGESGEPFTKGNWMIRVGLDRKKTDDPLRPQVESPSLAELTDKIKKPQNASSDGSDVQPVRRERDKR